MKDERHKRVVFLQLESKRNEETKFQNGGPNQQLLDFNFSRTE